MLASLYESWQRLSDYFFTGGPVMLPLLAVSLAMWLLIADRLLFFRRLNRKTLNSRTAWEHIAADRLPDPLQHGGVTALLVTRFLAKRSGDPRLDRFILDETVVGLNHHMRDFLALIGALAFIAPLLGLLGTVTGMITTFDVLALFGTGNAKAMAGGISEALITTETGLVVAIPGLYMKGYLDRRAGNLEQRVSVMGYFLKRQLSSVEELPKC